MKLSKKFIAMFREEAKKAQWEINRWNGKSIDDLVVDYLERKELKPEDFTGVVILTVEEANLLFNVIDGFFDMKLHTTKEIVALNKLKVRVERIAKAEMNDVQTIRNLS